VPLVRDWDAVWVWNWVTAWGVSRDCADVMFKARVDGPRLKDLYMAGYTGNNAEWAAVGIATSRDVQAVNDACDYLRDTYWIVEEWVGGPFGMPRLLCTLCAAMRAVVCAMRSAWGLWWDAWRAVWRAVAHCVGLCHAGGTGRQQQGHGTL
jgi:hypothetical protein